MAQSRENIWEDGERERRGDNVRKSYDRKRDGGRRCRRQILRRPVSDTTRERTTSDGLPS